MGQESNLHSARRAVYSRLVSPDDQAHAKGEQGDSNPPPPGSRPGVLPLHHEHHDVPDRAGRSSTEQGSNLPRAPCEGAALPMSYRS
jgi:hypothetical protein